MSSQTAFIYANATRYPNFISMEIVRPDTILPAFARVADELEGQQMIDNLNRDYILLKITGWLRQRKKGLERGDQINRSMLSARLEVELSQYSKHGLSVICDLVKQYADSLEALAPSATAGHYTYYTDTILPIIKFCKSGK